VHGNFGIEHAKGGFMPMMQMIKLYHWFGTKSFIIMILETAHCKARFWEEFGDWYCKFSIYEPF
jgi:hypothetical protein